MGKFRLLRGLVVAKLAEPISWYASVANVWETFGQSPTYKHVANVICLQFPALRVVVWGSGDSTSG